MSPETSPSRRYSTLIVACLLILAPIAGVISSSALSPVQTAEAQTDELAFFNNGGSVTAVDPSGNEQWSTGVSGTPLRITPGVNDEFLYVGTDDGTIAKLAVSDGSTEWTISKSSRVFDLSPGPDGETLYAGIDGTVQAFEISTQTKEWEYTTKGPPAKGIVPGQYGKTVYAAEDDGVTALSTSDGSEEWRKNLPNVSGDFGLDLGPNGEHLIHVAFTSEKGITKIEISSQDTVWQNGLPDRATGVAVADDGTVYAGDEESNVAAFAADDGSKLWSKSASARAQALEAVKDGEGVFVGTRYGKLDLVDSSGSSQIYDTGGSDIEAVTNIPNSMKPPDPGVAITGTVTDTSGNPAEGVDVSARVSGTADIAGSSTTGSNGEYFIPADPDSYEVVADSGLATESKSLSISEGINNLNFSLLAGDVGGRVVDQDGTPVGNATVEVVGYDVAEIQSQFASVDSEAEARQKARELDQKLDDLTPSAFEELTTDDLLSRLQSTDDPFVAAHSPSAWENAETLETDITPLLTDFSFYSFESGSVLSEPPGTVYPDEGPLALSIWEPTADPFAAVGQTLPGASTSGEITIETLGPDGSVTNSKTVETEPILDETTETEAFGFTVPTTSDTKTHQAAVVDLSEGFYRISAEGSDYETVIRVGNSPEEDVFPGYVQEVTSERDEYQSIADQFQQYNTDGLIDKTFRTTTSGDGIWSVDLPDPVQIVGVTAHKADGTIIHPTANGALTQITDAVDAGILDRNASVMLPTQPIRTDVPSRLEVQTKRVDAGSVLDSQISDIEDLRGLFQDWLNNETGTLAEELGLDASGANFTKLLDQYEQLETLLEDADTGDLSDERLQQIIDEIGQEEFEQITNPNEDRIADLEQQLQDSEQDREQLLTELAELEGVVAELRDETNQGDATVTNNVLSGEFPFPGDVEEDSIDARVQFADGTTRTVPEENINVRSDGFGPFSTETVVIDDLEVTSDRPNPQLKVDAVVDDSDIVGAVAESENPAFSGDRIDVSALDVSTLAPEPGETVSVSPRRAESAGAHKVTDATVWGPDGSVIEHNITDDASGVGSAVVFDAQGSGSHTVELVMETAGGVQFVERATIQGRDTSAGVPPTVRMRAGEPPLAGDRLVDASVASGDGSTQVTAVVPADREISEVHIRNGEALDQNTVGVEVVQGANQERVSRFVTVQIHESLSEDTLLYANGEPVTRDGETPFGEVYDGERIEIVTDDTGQAELSLVRDPGVIDRVQHWVSVQTTGLPIIGTIVALGGLIRYRGRIREVVIRD